MHLAKWRTLKLRLQIVLKMIARNGWTIIVIDHFCQIWQNEILMKWALFHQHFFASERNVDGHFSIVTCPCFDILASYVLFGGMFAFK